MDDFNRLLTEAITRPDETVHPGDAVATLNRMPVESVDAVVTSPPYTIKNLTGNGLKDGRGGKWRARLCKPDTPIMTITCRTKSTSRGRGNA
ncbi:MAG: hypothetical protein OXE94_11050 [Aestuariivita sp.]|nr:hypothetical protein [Aestuariivita sp.]